MRGTDHTTGELFSYRPLEARIPQDHRLHPFKVLVDSLLRSMDEAFESLYAPTGRASIPPGHLLRAALLQVLYTVRSGRQLVEQIDFTSLYRWFFGLSMDDAVWDHAAFTQNRERRFNQDVARSFVERIKDLAEWGWLTRDEHFSVDGSLIDAWASHKSA